MASLTLLGIILLVSTATSTCFIDQVWDFNEIVIQKNIQYGANYNPLTKKNESLTLDLYTPPSSDNRTARPAFVLVHGGSFKSGDSTSDDEPEFAQTLASRGFVVVSINYRLTGTFYGLNSEQPALDATEDARAAVRFVRKNADDGKVDGLRPQPHDVTLEQKK